MIHLQHFVFHRICQQIPVHFCWNSLSEKIVWNNVSQSAHFTPFFYATLPKSKYKCVENIRISRLSNVFNATINLPPNFDHGCLSEAEILQNKQNFCTFFYRIEIPFEKIPFASRLLIHFLLSVY